MRPFNLSITNFKGLNEDENRVFRNFNILLLISLLDIAIIALALSKVEPQWPFYLCLLQFFLFIGLFLLHLKGYLLTSRFIAFVLSTILQAIASITSGKAAGFDYLFFVISVLPLMFFNSKRQYIPLFLISITVYLLIQLSYNYITPIVIIDNQFLLYWNIFITAVIIFLVMLAFKSGYQESQLALIKQNQKILQQKEEIELINNNLEQLVNERSKQVIEHENRFIQFAHINAHRVRSPLARILGLINLIELEEDKHKTITEFVPVLKSNAHELNSMLKEVDTILTSTNLEKQEGDYFSSSDKT